MYDFKGRYAVVTGAGKGIGFAVAERLVHDGCAGVAMLDMDEELVKKSAAEIGGFAVKCDVSDKASVEAAFAAVYAKFGRVDILVNNAGITRDAMFHKMTDDQMSKVINVHLFGTYYCTQAVYTKMREQSYGKIVNISSTSSYGNIGQVNYAAAKGAIESFTHCLAKEAARKNITVNAIAPGMINTDILKTIPKDIYDAKIAAHPMQRCGEPSELAAAVCFLASDDSSFVTGTVLPVCGGMQIRG